MAIIINLDIMLAKKKMRSKELAKRIGITEQNLSILKNGKVKAVRIVTLNNICQALECQPGDILEFDPNADEEEDEEEEPSFINDDIRMVAS